MTGAILASSSCTVSSMASTLLSVWAFTCSFCSFVRSMRTNWVSLLSDIVGLEEGGERVMTWRNLRSYRESIVNVRVSVVKPFTASWRFACSLEIEAGRDAGFQLLDGELDRFGALLGRVLDLLLLLGGQVDADDLFLAGAGHGGLCGSGR